MGTYAASVFRQSNKSRTHNISGVGFSYTKLASVIRPGFGRGGGVALCFAHTIHRNTYMVTIDNIDSIVKTWKYSTIKILLAHYRPFHWAPNTILSINIVQKFEVLIISGEDQQ